MKYYYQKPTFCEQQYGRTIFLDEHPVYKCGTLIQNGSKKLIIVQKRFNPGMKTCYWDAIDPWLANDIYLNPNFPSYFAKITAEENSPIVMVRQIMWALRMKPLPREEWEGFF